MSFYITTSIIPRLSHRTNAHVFCLISWPQTIQYHQISSDIIRYHQYHSTFLEGLYWIYPKFGKCFGPMALWNLSATKVCLAKGSTCWLYCLGSFAFKLLGASPKVRWCTVWDTLVKAGLMSRSLDLPTCRIQLENPWSFWMEILYQLVTIDDYEIL